MKYLESDKMKEDFYSIIKQTYQDIVSNENNHEIIRRQAKARLEQMESETK